MAIARSAQTIINTTFTGDTKATLMAGIRSNLLSAGFTSIVGAAPTTVSITIASPGVFTMTSGTAPADGTRVVITTTGAVPTGMTAATTVYFVKSPVSNTFNIAATSGGTAINLTGSQSGTHTAVFECVLESATTPQSLKARFRFRDNGGSCITASLESALSPLTVLGSNDTTNGCHILPATARTWRIICTGYYFWLMVPSIFRGFRDFLWGHVPWIPSTMTSVTFETACLFSHSFTDTTPTATASVSSFRNAGGNVVSAAVGNWQALWNGALCANANNSLNSGVAGASPNTYFPRFDGPLAASSTLVLITKYSDGSFITCDPWLTFAVISTSPNTSIDNDVRIRGMLWDAVHVQDPTPTGDTTASFDGNTWYCLTNLAQPALWVLNQ